MIVAQYQVPFNELFGFDHFVVILATSFYLVATFTLASCFVSLSRSRLAQMFALLSSRSKCDTQKIFIPISTRMIALVPNAKLKSVSLVLECTVVLVA